MPDTRRALIVWIVAMGLTLLSLLLHFTSPSTLRDAEDVWADRVAYHQTKPSFAVRPLTTSAVVLLHDAVGWSYRTAFFALQFALLLLSGPALDVYLRQLGFAHRESLVGMSLFYLSLPVLLAHFEPVYTWGDMWVYLFVPLGFAAALKGRPVLSAAMLAVAILARETSLVFVIPWMLFLHARFRPRTWSLVVFVVITVGASAAVRSLWTSAGLGPSDWELEERTNLLAYNFASFVRSRDSVFSILAGLGVLWPVGLYQLFRSSDYTAARYFDQIRLSAVITVVGFTVPTLLFMQARETRLFFPPFIFLVPLALVFLRQHEGILRSLWKDRPSWVRIAASLVAWLVGITIARLAFPDFEYRKWRDGNWVIFGLHVAAAIGFGLVLWRSRRAREDFADATSYRRTRANRPASRSTPRSDRTGLP